MGHGASSTGDHGAVISDIGWAYATGREFVVVMLITAIANRVNAYLRRRSDPKSSGRDTSALVLRPCWWPRRGCSEYLGSPSWYQQAPWMMLIPIGYMIASRLWRGHSAEWPLYWVAQTATAMILCMCFGATMNDLAILRADGGEMRSSMMLALVFAEAAGFYLLAGLFRRRSVNIHLAAAAACASCCGSSWAITASTKGTIRCSTRGSALRACLSPALSGSRQVTAYRFNNQKSLVTRGRGLAAFQCGNGILCVAVLAAIMQGLSGLATKSGDWLDILSMFVTTAAAALAAAVVPAANWRRLYSTAAMALAAVTFLRLNC